jgi:hypothetical protein
MFKFFFFITYWITLISQPSTNYITFSTNFNIKDWNDFGSTRWKVQKQNILQSKTSYGPNPYYNNIICFRETREHRLHRNKSLSRLGNTYTYNNNSNIKIINAFGGVSGWVGVRWYEKSGVFKAHYLWCGETCGRRRGHHLNSTIMYST